MEALKFIWQLPQILAAYIYYLYLDCKGNILDTCTYQDAVVFVKKTADGSVTLGDHIFLSSRASDKTLQHEYGHTRQSLMLGPLYLIIIGIPSILWAATHNVLAPNTSYYKFFSEMWADKLGRVKR